MLIDENSALSTESDVEQKILFPLLTGDGYLGIPVANVHTKEYLPPTPLDKAAGKTIGYYPDYSIWFHGLPVMIIEAKSPDVDPQIGYREASLYARHLNQKFPAGVNPCARIISSNGNRLLYGPWDAAPEIELSLSDLNVGTAGLENLQSRCFGHILDKSAIEISQRLQLINIVIPYDLLGGQAVLNAKRPLNTFAADLSPVLRRYFSSTPQENVHEIAEKAYISSNEVTEYDRVLESLLKERLSLRQTAIVKPLEPSRREEPNVAHAIASFDEQRPMTGQLQIVQGPVGAGKSLFARRYCDVLQDPDQAKRTRWAFIDFNTGAISNTLSPERWLYESFMQAFQSENPSLDVYSASAQRGIFSRNLQRRRSVYEELERVSPESAAVQRATDLAKWQDDPKEFTQGLATYILGSRHEVLVVVMDNVDRLDLNGQLTAFNIALSFMALTKCFVILQMRDETYERFKDKPPLDTYRSGITFHISPPRFIDVVKRRLELSLEYLTAHAAEVQRYTLESGMRISYPKSALGWFLGQLYLELFERRHNISRVLEALAGWDVRRALEMFVSVITSGHLSEESITSSVMGAKSIPIREHTVLKILMRTDYRFASDQSGYIINVFGFDKEWERPDNFLLVEALYYLTANRKKRGEIGLEGYFTCRHVANALQQFSYVPEDVLAALNHLLRKRLIVADHMNHTSVAFDDSVRILAAGFMHLRVLTERLEYLFGILPTVPIADRHVAQQIARVLEKEKLTGEVLATEKIRAVRHFLRYLWSLHASVRGRSVHAADEYSGADYVLKKIAACLANFYIKGIKGIASPDEEDVLDL
ncbi:MAG: hypothetical protein HYX72_03215 [Acidobacteria bacterium]|nr:hypothetical protein [Acidobacteriota bacterium]